MLTCNLLLEEHGYCLSILPAARRGDWFGLLLNVQTRSKTIDHFQLNVHWMFPVSAQHLCMPTAYEYPPGQAQNPIFFPLLQEKPTIITNLLVSVIYFFLLLHSRPSWFPVSFYFLTYSALVLAWPLLSTVDPWLWEIWPVTTLGGKEN